MSSSSPPPRARRARPQERAFGFRAGVRLQGTIVACDASAGSDLIFLSHATALDARATRALPRGRTGKRQLLTTELTLALLGAAGERLRSHALLAPPGRPFALGPLRLELFPSGYMPGAASLLCEVGGRRVVYAGRVGRAGAGVRTGDALCLDACFGEPSFAFPEPAEAVEDVRRFVTAALAARRPPVVLVDEPGPALQAAAVLTAGGVRLRAHPTLVAAAATFREVGLEAPTLSRFDGRLRAGEALLWPRTARQAARLRALEAPAVLLASPWAAAPEGTAGARAEQGVALAAGADFAGLIHYVEATGASEVALLNQAGEDLPRALRDRGIDSYPLGPPRQFTIPRIV
jgi:putative mRNA 3-end processing factor